MHTNIDTYIYRHLHTSTTLTYVYINSRSLHTLYSITLHYIALHHIILLTYKQTSIYFASVFRCATIPQASHASLFEVLDRCLSTVDLKAFFRSSLATPRRWWSKVPSKIWYLIYSIPRKHHYCVTAFRLQGVIRSTGAILLKSNPLGQLGPYHVLHVTWDVVEDTIWVSASVCISKHHNIMKAYFRSISTTVNLPMSSTKSVTNGRPQLTEHATVTVLHCSN